jgi:hypothetical protein
LARAAGLEVVDLSPAFDSVTDRSSLGHRQVGRSHHGAWSPSTCGQIVAGLVPLLFASQGKQQTSLLQSRNELEERLGRFLMENRL